jgi:hypothetical protein
MRGHGEVGQTRVVLLAGSLLMTEPNGGRHSISGPQHFDGRSRGLLRE